MLAIRGAWDATAAVLAEIRRDQEWTVNKYAPWAAGYRDKLGRVPIRCRCGEMFDAGDHDQTMVHIKHITSRRAGT